MNPEAITRTTVHFSGHVQGVGFRYTVMQVVKGYEVTGFVQNLADGRVLLVAEGDRRENDEFVKAVEDRLTGYIRKTERADESSAVRQHQSFVIR